MQMVYVPAHASATTRGKIQLRRPFKLAAATQQGWICLATGGGETGTVHDEIKPPAVSKAFEDIPDEVADGY